MGKARGPPEKRNTPKWKKYTPSTDDSVLPRWQARYSELRGMDYSKWGALFKIGEEYKLNPSTIERHLFPEQNAKQKNLICKTWAHEKANPEIYEKRIAYKRKYMAVRRHIQDYVVESLSHSDTPQTMEQISESIRRQTSISLSPLSLEGLCQKVEATTGQQFLIPHPTVPPTYSLAPGHQS